MSAIGINPASTNPTSTAATGTAAVAADPLADQDVFLQLLVAQLKNQDPDNPADGTTFITQLAQFSELSNTTQMASDLGTIQNELAPVPPTTPVAPVPSTTPASTTTPPTIS
jgi:flagellar basal-body rod modification protein FlgD